MANTDMRRKLAMMLDNYTVTVSGIPPLSTYKRRLLSLKAFGGTEQNGTPAPDTPVDIVSNNGMLKARHQSGLPLGYTLLESIVFTGTQYINTGLNINNNTRVLFDVKKSTSSAQANYPWLGGVRDYVNNTNINKKTLEFSKTDSTKMYLQYARSGEISLIVPNTTQRHTYDFNKNELYIDENLIYTATQETFTSNATFLIGTVYSQGSISTFSIFYGDVYGFKLWQDGTNLSMNLIPVQRNSDNVIGMYDLVSDTFFMNNGTGNFVAGNPINDPVVGYADSTVETITSTPGGSTVTTEMLLKLGDYQDVQSILDGAVTRNIGVLVLDGTENWSLGTVFTLDNAVQRAVFPSTSMSTHFVGNESSTAPNMFRNNSFKVGASGYRNRIYIKATQYADETAFKAFLAQQYANGTPVIIVYPLETPTTETVAGQSMAFMKGLNTVEITQASLDNLELEIKAR